MHIKYCNQLVDMPERSNAEDLAEKLNLSDPQRGLAACINGVTCDLSHPLAEGDEVKFWDFENPEGREIFWHTSAHLLAQGVLRLWPEAKPTIGPPIENGFYYDFANLHLSEEDFPKLEKEIKCILNEKFKLERFSFKRKEEALKAFENNPFKKEIIEGFEEGSPITAYRQGEFFDLCRGPHLSHLRKIRAFKILKTSGAYWRGDSNNPMLTRIYGISFPHHSMMQTHLHMIEEAKKRDHRIIGTQQNLFSFQEEAPAMPFFHPRGMALWDHLVDYWKESHLSHGYEIIKTPQLLTKELWKLSGHWGHYQENMFKIELGEGRTYVVKPMNCPGCILYYKTRAHSYREFPLKIAEFGHVHRREPSGACNGLFRVQSFHQDDAHLFMQPTQIKDEILRTLKFVKEVYQTFGLAPTFELSTRPKKSIGTDEDWKMTTQGLQDALNSYGEPYKINEGDGAFYGPKIDLHVHDAIKRGWQCGTLQLDMALPQQFNLEYRDSDGLLKRPIMIHRAIFGSIERFLGILIEHFAGKFPLWMSPLPIRLIPVADRHIPYARDVLTKVRAAGFLSDIDTTSESVSKKVRSAQLLQVNYMLILGDRESKNKTVTLRTRDNRVHGEMHPEEFLKQCLLEYRERRLLSPF